MPNLPNRGSLPRLGLHRRRHRQPVMAYEGRVQGVSNGRVIGWVWDPQAPERRVEVAIEIGGELIAQVLADQPRDDLLSERIGDGAHGFVIELPAPPRARGRVRLVALAGPEQSPIHRSPSFWHEAKPGSPWDGARFSYGRGEESEWADDEPAEAPPPPSPSPVRTLVGSDGWLFDAAELEPLDAPQPDGLERLAGRLSATAAACAELGILYLPACVPSKFQALPGVVPVSASRVWMDTLRARLRDGEGVELFDLLPVLFDAARHGPCYHRSDADWNARGAFFAARALIAEAGKGVPGLRPIPMSALHLEPSSGYRGILAEAPKVRIENGTVVPSEEETLAEDGVEVDASRLTAERMPVERHLVTGDEIHVRLLVGPQTGSAPRLSVVGGSACLALLPWLGECASRTTFFWAALPPLEPIELELPDAVLHLIRYRDLAGLGRPA
jgi:hypothetical protein